MNLWIVDCPSNHISDVSVQYRGKFKKSDLYLVVYRAAKNRMLYLVSKSAKDSRRKEYLLMPTLSGFANQGSIIKTGYTFDEEVHASSSEGLSWSRSPLRNQCIAAVCFFVPDILNEMDWTKRSPQSKRRVGRRMVTSAAVSKLSFQRQVSQCRNSHFRILLRHQTS